MIKRNWVYILFVLSVIIFITSKWIEKKQDSNTEVNIETLGRDHKTGKNDSVYIKHLHLSSRTIHGNLGWGYEILKNDSVYIRQEIIPAIQGRKSFISEEEANRIANLVLYKMKRGKLQFPDITIHDLDSCKITR